VEGLPIEVRELPDEQSEAEFVARTIVRLSSGSEGEAEYDRSESDEGIGSYSILDRLLALQKKRGRVVMRLPQLPVSHAPLSDFAVLFRTHAQSRAMEEAFVRSGIPYRVVGGVRFYERKEVKDVLAYVRLALNHRDRLALQRVVNEPSRGVGDKSLGKIREVMSGKAGASIQEIRASVGALGLTARAQKGADEFFFLIEHFQELSESEELPALLRLVVNRVGFKNMLRDGTDMGETRWENVQELVSVAAKFAGVPTKR
jgi:DNA helicase-2/ATP-dependent DNA helicase PcrA